MVGPAYAWSHIHLTMKQSKDIYELELLQNQIHPADEARFRMLEFGLRNLGYTDVVHRLHSKWLELAKFWSLPPIEYQYAYPDSLLAEVSKQILEGVELCSLSVAYPSVLSGNSDAIRYILNHAWDTFWSRSGDGFREWEIEQLASLRKVVTQPA